MASILDKYGIKEVADVVFYELDSKGAPSAPVLYLDTLKVSTIEQSAEVVDATGGKGNVKLISWDTNKEVTATFEDALFSVKSLAIMFGGQVSDNGANQEVLKTVPYSALTDKDTDWEFMLNGKAFRIGKTDVTYFKYSGAEVVATTKDAKDADFVTFDLLDAKSVAADGTTGQAITMNGLEIQIDASTFGGTYYITGDTYARDYVSGKDEFLQFIIPKGKVSSEDLSLTMEADGDPATFSMNINVLKAADGSMFKLVKYTISGDEGLNKNKGVASVLGSYDKDGIQNAGYASGTNASKVTTSKPTSTNDMG